MVKNVLKMSKWFSVPLALSFITISSGSPELVIVQHSEQGRDVPVSGTIETTVGSNLALTCLYKGVYGGDWDAELVWGRRTKDLRFKNETDLIKLAKEGSKHIYELAKDPNEPYQFHELTKNFVPVRLTDRGAHFCGSLKYMLFKIVHIKVKDKEPGFPKCSQDKFQCTTSGICINLHYKCDGKSDCFDGSDEDWYTCKGNPCKGKIRCRDGRCIPTTWCCDKHTDANCTVAVRPSCCPPLPDRYDPMLYYDQSNVKAMHKSSGPRYLFVTICVVTAILSFVLFLFIISKICGFDKKPHPARNTRNQPAAFSNRCDHSQCTIRREFNPDAPCFYHTATNLNSDSNELENPLIGITTISMRGCLPGEVSDQPPSYAEVIASPPSIDKCALDDLINAPPPPYSSTKLFLETENVRASDFVHASNNDNNQSTRCDIGSAGDRNRE